MGIPHMYALSLKNDKEGMPMVRSIVILCVLVIMSMSNLCAVTSASAEPLRIMINLPSATLTLVSGDNIIKEYLVAVGKPSTPTPLGSYSIFYKEVNPPWIPFGKNYIVPSGPDNPLGYRWMEFSPMYGIHGTNAPWTIGQPISNGCVRMYEAEVEEVYEKIKIGSPLVISYERIAVDIDKLYQVSVAVYPDIYGYEPEVSSELEQKLASIGIAGWWDEELVERMLRQPWGKKIVIGKVYPLVVDGREVNVKAIEQGSTVYVPVWALATAVSNTSNITWKDSAKLVVIDGVSMSAIVRGNVIYVTLTQAQEMFTGHSIQAKGYAE